MFDRLLEERHLGIELLSEGGIEGHSHDFDRIPEFLRADSECMERIVGGEIGLSGLEELLPAAKLRETLPTAQAFARRLGAVKTVSQVCDNC